MNAKSILIPLAAFAVTVTGASAFNSEVLQNAGLTDTEIAAFEEAKELRESGDREGARDVLESAGISEETLRKVHDAMHEWRDEHRQAVDDAVENEDYNAFLAAIEGTPLADIIDSEVEFEQFVEAHNLMKDGDRDEAKEIFDELGIEKPVGHGHRGPRNLENAPFWDQLSDSDKEAIQAAKGDRDKIKEILEAAGIDLPERGEGGHHHGHDDDEDDD